MKISRIRLNSKPFYITTPIFYVNASPHVGHLYSMVLADTVKRWKSLSDPSKGSYLLTGTDEHGLKVQQAAKKAGFTDPKPFVDEVAENFKSLAARADISYSRFIRTTDADHIKASQTMWEKLRQNGYIYKDKHKGWYSVSDEAFVPENQLEKSENGQLISKESQKPVEWFEEDNYFFALSKLRNQLLDLYNNNPQFVIPKDKFSFIYNEVESGLSDLSISRPKSRCAWGIPVPHDTDHVMYVWMDALTNYLTYAGYPDHLSDKWPADAHVVGKDIQRFHAIYWPAFLIAAGLQPPKQIVVHSHWTMDGSKMSKSLGNVADPFKAMEMFGAESVKFFLQYDGYIDHDMPYNSDRLISRHDVELMNKYGNLIMRVCGPKFNINRSLGCQLDGSSDIKTRIDGLYAKVDELVSSFDTARALGHIWSLIADTNLYIQNKEPWRLTGNDQDAIIRDAAEVGRVSSILLTAFVPKLANRCLDRLGVSPEKRTIEYAKYGADSDYGRDVNYKGNPPITALKVAK